MRHVLITPLFCFATLSATAALATETVPPAADAFRVVATDQAPSAFEAQVNPSKAEPMMIEPSRASETAAYQRDIAVCEDRTAESRQACRDFVNGTYGIDIAEPSARLGTCSALDGAARTECLNSGSSGG